MQASIFFTVLQGRILLLIVQQNWRIESDEYFFCFFRPNSAPSIKPRPPSARRYQVAGSNKHNRTRTSPTGRALNPQYLYSGQDVSNIFVYRRNIKS